MAVPMQPRRQRESETVPADRRRCASLLILEKLAQLRLASLIVNARRSDRDARDVGGSGDCQILIEHEVKHFSLSRRQPVERGDESSNRFVLHHRAETTLRYAGHRMLAPKHAEGQRRANRAATPFFARRSPDDAKEKGPEFSVFRESGAA